MICSAQDQESRRLGSNWQVPVGKLRPPKSFGSPRESAHMSGSHAESGSSRRKHKTVRLYKGVRMRTWGRWVTEIRQPQTKKSIWLGSYRSAEEAAHAYDAAVLCLRGPTAKLNFPDERPAIPPGSPGKYSIREVQAAAAGAAAASAGRRFSYSEFMSATTPPESIDPAPEHINCPSDSRGTSPLPADRIYPCEFDEDPLQATWEVPDEMMVPLTPREVLYDSDSYDGFPRDDLPPWNT